LALVFLINFSRRTHLFAPIITLKRLTVSSGQRLIKRFWSISGPNCGVYNRPIA